jgi:hypothetical protein
MPLIDKRPGSSGGGGAVDSVNGQTGIVILTAASVGAEPAGSNVVYPYTLILADITAKQITLPSTPVNPLLVTVDVITGVKQDEGSDFTVSGAVLSWNALGYEALAAVGDQLVIKYRA